MLLFQYVMDETQYIHVNLVVHVIIVITIVHIHVTVVHVMTHVMTHVMIHVMINVIMTVVQTHIHVKHGEDGAIGLIQVAHLTQVMHHKQNVEMFIE